MSSLDGICVFVGFHSLRFIHHWEWSEARGYIITLTFYMDNLSLQLHRHSIGCSVGRMVANHMLYADDIFCVLPSIINLGTVLLNSRSCIKLICIDFDLSELIVMSLCSVHLIAMSTECCRADSLFLWHISNSVLSSTYLYNGTCVSRSFMHTRKHLGPSNVPCGTPSLGCPGGEKLLPILMCWVLYPTGKLQSTFDCGEVSHTVLIL